MDFSPRFWNNDSFGIHSSDETQRLREDLDQNNFLPLLFLLVLFLVVIYDAVCIFWCLRNFQLWQICNTSSEDEIAEIRWEPHNRLAVFYEENRL